MNSIPSPPPPWPTSPDAAAAVPTQPNALTDFQPVPRRGRHDGWTVARQHIFIAALADSGSVTHAAAQAGKSTVSAYQLRRARNAESFAAAWQAALDQGVRRLEDIAMERAIHGVEVPVYSYGKLVGTRRVYNDRLLMFLLRCRAPDRFTPLSPAHASHKALTPDPNSGPGSPAAIAAVERVLQEVRRRRALAGT